MHFVVVNAQRLICRKMTLILDIVLSLALYYEMRDRHWLLQ